MILQRLAALERLALDALDGSSSPIVRAGAETLLGAVAAAREAEALERWRDLAHIVLMAAELAVKLAVELERIRQLQILERADAFVKQLRPINNAIAVRGLTAMTEVATAREGRRAGAAAAARAAESRVAARRRLVEAEAERIAKDRPGLSRTAMAAAIAATLRRSSIDGFETGRSQASIERDLAAIYAKNTKGKAGIRRKP